MYFSPFNTVWQFPAFWLGLKIQYLVRWESNRGGLCEGNYEPCPFETCASRPAAQSSLHLLTSSVATGYVRTSHPGELLDDVLRHCACSGLWGMALAYILRRVFRSGSLHCCRSEAKALISWTLRSWVRIKLKAWVFVLVFLCCCPV
jgi:hypothetical protein